MKLGLFGKTGAGRKTIFEALSQGLRAEAGQPRARKGGQVAMVQVPDPRLEPLSAMFHPQKTTPARLTFALPDDSAGAAQAMAELASLDGLLMVLGNFPGAGGGAPDKTLRELEEELILRDLAVAEGKLERLKKGRQKAQAVSADEERLIGEALALLNEGRPLRANPEFHQSPLMRSYAFLSAKPRMVVVNNADGQLDPPAGLGLAEPEMLVLQGRLEGELAQLPPEEAAQFREEYGLGEPVINRVVRACYRLMGLSSFFTVGEDEVRAWTIPAGAPAIKAAEAIHSDLAKGFIRAEVVFWEDLVNAGSLAEARKKALLRLEGKEYPVKDGDVLTIRFNV